MLKPIAVAAALLASTAFADEATLSKDLKHAYLHKADLRGADLKHADLRKAQLSGAQLDGADLRGANLEGAYLFKASLKGADLRGARFTCKLGAATLSQVDLTGAIFDETTALPFSLEMAAQRAMVRTGAGAQPSRVAAVE